MRELEKVIGYEKEKKELYRIIDVLTNREKYEKLGVSIPKGIMFYGVPGIGKTLIAKCFIAETGRKSYTIRKDKTDGDFVNHITATFEKAAENEPSIVFLDDMDKFANGDTVQRDAEEYVTVQSCIDNVKEKDVLVVATFNDISRLPASLVRDGRFDKKYYMVFPSGKDARKIIAFYLKSKKVSNDVDIEEIARLCNGCACARLEKIVNDAGIIAGSEGKDMIENADIIQACMKDIYNTCEECVFDEDHEAGARAIAAHEAGHAVIAELRNPGSVTLAQIKTSDRYVNGDVTVQKGNRPPAFEDYETEILISLAGKAATEILLGDIDIGVTQDIKDARGFIREMAKDLAVFGFSVPLSENHISEMTRERLDMIITAEAARYYQMAKKMLVQNRKLLEAVAEALYNEKVLLYKRIAEIKAQVAQAG